MQNGHAFSVWKLRAAFAFLRNHPFNFQRLRDEEMSGRHIQVLLWMPEWQVKSFWDGTCSKEHVPSTFVLNTNLGLFTKETKLDDLGCAVCNDNPNDKKI